MWSKNIAKARTFGAYKRWAYRRWTNRDMVAKMSTCQRDTRNASSLVSKSENSGQDEDFLRSRLLTKRRLIGLTLDDLSVER